MVRPKHNETQIPLKNCKNQDEEQEMMAHSTYKCMHAPTVDFIFLLYCYNLLYVF